MKSELAGYEVKFSQYEGGASIGTCLAHRAEQKVYIPVLAEEKDSVIHGDAGSALRTAPRVLIRTVVVMNLVSQEGGEFPSHEEGVIIATAGSAVGLELITMA